MLKHLDLSLRMCMHIAGCFASSISFGTSKSQDNQSFGKLGKNLVTGLIIVAESRGKALPLITR